MFDYVSMNHTNAVGRHILAWSSSAHRVFDILVPETTVGCLNVIGHAVLTAVVILIMFNLWRIPFLFMSIASCAICRPFTADKRPFFHVGLNPLEWTVILAMIVILYICAMTNSLGCIPGKYIAQCVNAIGIKLNPMNDLFPDWTVYPKQLLAYICSLCIWCLWWVPAVLIVEIPAALAISEIRRNHEPIQGGDNGLGG